MVRHWQNLTTNSRTYKIWKSMIYRCTISKTESFPRYGGRGIIVCSRWIDSWDNFFEDMGNCPPGHSIERRDNNGDYEPENCHWARSAEQNRNRADNVFLSAFGKTQTLSEWAREIGVSIPAIKSRLKNHPSEIALRSGRFRPWGLIREFDL